MDFEMFSSTLLSPKWQTENLINDVDDLPLDVDDIDTQSAAHFDVISHQPETNSNITDLVDVAEDDNLLTMSPSVRDDDAANVTAVCDNVDWRSAVFNVDTRRCELSPPVATRDVIVAATAATAAVNHDGEENQCKVCGGHAAGMYFGARVCVPCKTFFLRYCDMNEFTCRKGTNVCQVSVSTRTECQHCRYQKCLQVGMIRKVRPTHVNLADGQLMCVVCGDVGNGLHFGVISCEGCKKFFRRGLVENTSFSCSNNEKCVINPRTRNSCRHCRYRRCLQAGMSRFAIQMGRPPRLRMQLPQPAAANIMCPDLKAGCVKLTMTHLLASTADSSSSRGHFPVTVNEEPVAMASSDASRKRHARTPSSSVLHIRSMPFGHVGSSTTIRKDSGFVDDDDDVQPDSTDTDNESLSEQSDHRDVSGGMPIQNADEATLTSSWMDKTIVTGLLSTGGIDVAIQHTQARPNFLCTTYNVRPAYQAISLSPPIHIASHQPSLVIAIPAHSAVMMTSPCSDVIQPKSRVAFGSDESAAKRHCPEVSFAPVGQNCNDPSRHSVVGSHNMGDIVESCVASGVYGGGEVSMNDVSLGSPSVTSSTKRFRLENTCVHDTGCDVNIASNAASNLTYAPTEKAAHDVTYSVFSARDSVDEDNMNMHTMLQTSHNYWLCPHLPDDNVLFAGDHWLLIKCIIPSYHRFVNRSKKLNDFLGLEYEKWKRLTNDTKQLPKWIENTVIPLYTLSSVKYCQSLPGFTHLALEDQATLIRLGQSSSRILVAAHQWFDAEQHRFRNFLPWRRDYEQTMSADVSTTSDGGGAQSCNLKGDLFKQELVSFCDSIQELQLDSVEAGLLNVLLIFATDLPNLKGVDFIERIRQKILLTFRAYTTAKYGSPNNRLEEIFSFMPSCRRLGLLHYLMTTTTTITMEEVQATHAVDMTLGLRST